MTGEATVVDRLHQAVGNSSLTDLLTSKYNYTSLPLPTNGNERQPLHHPLHCGVQLPLSADSHACQGREYQR